MKNNMITMLAGLVVLLAFSNCSRTETLPFEADFTGTYTAIYVDSVTCGPGPWMRVIVNCTGECNVLGTFTTHFDFCADSAGYYPGQQMGAHMIADNGDTLFVECAGQVLEGRQEDHPEHVVSYWKDPFKILGGSGKFEGSTGEGMTDDYNSNLDQNSHHHWTGTITLVKEKG